MDDIFLEICFQACPPIKDYPQWEIAAKNLLTKYSKSEILSALNSVYEQKGQGIKEQSWEQIHSYIKGVLRSKKAQESAERQAERFRYPINIRPA